MTFAHFLFMARACHQHTGKKTTATRNKQGEANIATSYNSRGDEVVAIQSSTIEKEYLLVKEVINTNKATMAEAHDEFYLRYYVGHETQEMGKLLFTCTNHNCFTLVH